MRVRLRFVKLGKIRWTSHRDVARMWERALRRASVPVARSEGFSPRPKMSFGLALTTGHESLGEYLDVELNAEVEVEDLPARLSAALPVGIDVVAAVAIEKAPSLQQDVTSCAWELALPWPRDAAEVAVATALGAETLVASRERKGAVVTDDLRPGILRLEVAGAGEASGEEEHVVVRAELATQPRGLRPSELLGVAFAGADEAVVRVLRTHQWIERDGAKWEPIPLDATSPAYVLEAYA
jgi:radical SAM-linked protein